MAARILVTGASGFVGRSVVDELLQRGYEVAALVHRRPLAVNNPAVRWTNGSVFDFRALREAMADCSAIIHLIGIIRENLAQGVTFERLHFEATKNVVDVAQLVGIRRYVHISSLGARPNAPAEYHRTKFKAEEYVRASSLDWTILRPSLIHGPNGEMMQMEANWARGKAAPFLAMPYFAAGPLGKGGGGRIQPVYVGDVARAAVDVLEKPQAIGQTYDLGGPETMTWAEFHQTAGEAIAGKRPATLGVPTWLATALTAVVPPDLLPFNRDQVQMSQEDNTADLTHFRQDFGWEPRSLREMLAHYAGKL